MTPLLSLLLGIAPAASLQTARLSAEPAVPFFLYGLPAWTKDCDGYYAAQQNYFPEIAMYLLLREHPWRVENASQAELFYVPAFLGLSGDGLCGDHARNMEALEKMLTAQPFLEKNAGRDHLIAAFTYTFEKWKLGNMQAYSKNFIRATLEHNRYKDWPRAVAVPYGPVSVRGANFSQVPFEERTHSLFFMGKADNRWNYRTRRRAIRLLPSHWNDSVLVQVDGPWMQNRFPSNDTWDDPPMLKSSLPLCAVGGTTGCLMSRSLKKYVDLGRQSRYSLVMHGDTPSTSRLYDAAQFQQLPIILSDGFQEIAMPFAKDLPWEDMVVFIEQDEFARRAIESTQKAVDEANNKTKQETWKHAQKFLDWSLTHPCMGTALLSDVGRRFMGMDDLPPAWTRSECQSDYEQDHHGSWNEGVDMAKMEQLMLEGRL